MFLKMFPHTKMCFPTTSLSNLWSMFMLVSQDKDTGCAATSTFYPDTIDCSVPESSSFIRYTTYIGCKLQCF